MKIAEPPWIMPKKKSTHVKAKDEKILSGLIEQLKISTAQASASIADAINFIEGSRGDTANTGTNNTKSWADYIVQIIAHANLAHTEYANTPDDEIRFHDRETPYIVHPVWCAATLLQEPTLPLAIRKNGFAALLLHDTLEDTKLPLPEGISDEIAQLVQQMTFISFDEERAELWNRSNETRLLKLYDKVSNLLDGSWMKTEKWNIYVQHTLRLANDVELNFGMLNIVKIAQAVAVAK